MGGDNTDATFDFSFLLRAKKGQTFFLRSPSLARSSCPPFPLFPSRQLLALRSWLFLAPSLDSQIKGGREGLELGHSSVQTLADGLTRHQTSRLVFVRAAGPQPQSAVEIKREQERHGRHQRVLLSPFQPARPFPSVSLALIRFSGKLTKNSARCLHEGLLPLGEGLIKGKQRRENPLLPFFSPLGLNAEAVGGISHHISCSQRHIHYVG